MRSLRVLVPLALVVLGGCTLRPRYADLITPQLAADGTQVKLVLLEDPDRRPLAGVRVEMSEGKNRYTTVTAADGTFSVPVGKQFRDENPIMVLAPPAGVASYRVELAEAPVPVAPLEAPPLEAPPLAPPPAADPVKM